MDYRRRDAKDYAREHFKGIWAAALMPFAPDLAVDEAGLRRNLRHWIEQNADVRADGSNAETSPCDALSFGIRSCVSKSTRYGPKRFSYPSIHSKLSIRLHRK